MPQRAEHDRMTFDHPLPEGFEQVAMEAYIARGRMLQAKAMQQGFATAWRGLRHLFDFRLGLSHPAKADHA